MRWSDEMYSSQVVVLIVVYRLVCFVEFVCVFVCVCVL